MDNDEQQLELNPQTQGFHGFSLYGIVGNEGYRAVGLAPSGINAVNDGILLRGVRERNYELHENYYDPNIFLRHEKIRELFIYVPDYDRIPHKQFNPSEVKKYAETPLEARVFDHWNQDLTNRIVLCFVIPE